MAHQNQNQHYRSPFGDTTYTKVFVGGLAWETPTDLLHNYFLQFGPILEAVIITDKNTGKSKGYGFVTFRDPESANRACADPNPVIDGRRANCNIASLGRPNPSPGRNRTMNIYNGGGRGSSSYPPPLPPPTPVIYPPYGYTAYPQDYGYHQTMYYNQQQLYGSSSVTGSTPYYYGYAPRGGTFSIPPAQRIQGPSYLYYPTQLEGSSSPYHPQYHVLQQTPRLSFPSYTDSGAPPQSSTETEAGNSNT